MTEIKVLAFDIFGTTVDWRTGVAEQVSKVAAGRGIELDGGAFADDWRQRYIPSMDLVRRKEVPWVNLDGLHRRSLDDMLAERGIGSAFDEDSRQELVRAWHRLPAWADSVAGLSRLRQRYTVAAVSNGGFALLTNLVKDASLPFDCIISAELTRHYKPDPQVYLTVAELLDARPNEVMMVAAHVWDLGGARNAGLRTAFVGRPLEKGPQGRADRAADAGAELDVISFTELADVLGC
jgi:2-haloacid dehalogenase